MMNFVITLPIAIASKIHSYFDNVMTKFIVNNRTDAWKTDINAKLIAFLGKSLKH